jgi:hypothetical protein
VNDAKRNMGLELQGWKKMVAVGDVTFPSITRFHPAAVSSISAFCKRFVAAADTQAAYVNRHAFDPRRQH